MDDGVKGILSYLEETWESLLRVVEGADDRLIHWTPSPGFNSVAVLLRHLAGSERWWIGEAIGGIPSGRVRDAEFIPDRPDRGEVMRSVEASRELSRRVLEKISMADLRAEAQARLLWEARRDVPQNCGLFCIILNTWAIIAGRSFCCLSWRVRAGWGASGVYGLGTVLMRWEVSHRIHRRLRRIIGVLGFHYIDPTRLFCVRGYGSSSSAWARIWGLPALWQKVLGVPPAYV